MGRRLILRDVYEEPWTMTGILGMVVVASRAAP